MKKVDVFHAECIALDACPLRSESAAVAVRIGSFSRYFSISEGFAGQRRHFENTI
jgi:hypothetical protein